MNERVNNFLKHFTPEKLEKNSLQECMDFLRRKEVYEALRVLSYQKLSPDDINKLKDRISDYWNNIATLLTVNNAASTSFEVLLNIAYLYHKQHDLLKRFNLDFCAEKLVLLWCNRWLAMDWDSDIRSSSASLYHYCKIVKYYGKLFYDRNILLRLLQVKIISVLYAFLRQDKNSDIIAASTAAPYITNVFLSLGYLAQHGCVIQLDQALIKEALKLLFYYSHAPGKPSQGFSNFFLGLGYMARYGCAIQLENYEVCASLDVLLNIINRAKMSAQEIADFMLGVGYIAWQGYMFDLGNLINYALNRLNNELLMLRSNKKFTEISARAISTFFLGIRYIANRGSSIQLDSSVVDASLWILINSKQANLQPLINCLMALGTCINSMQRLNLASLPQVMNKIMLSEEDLSLVDKQHLLGFLNKISIYMTSTNIGVDASFIETLEAQVKTAAEKNRSLAPVSLGFNPAETMPNGTKRVIIFNEHASEFKPRTNIEAQSNTVMQQLVTPVRVAEKSAGVTILQQDGADCDKNSTNDANLSPPTVMQQSVTPTSIAVKIDVITHLQQDTSECSRNTGSVANISTPRSMLIETADRINAEGQCAPDKHSHNNSEDRVNAVAIQSGALQNSGAMSNELEKVELCEAIQSGSSIINNNINGSSNGYVHGHGGDAAVSVVASVRNIRKKNRSKKDKLLLEPNISVSKTQSQALVIDSNSGISTSNNSALFFTQRPMTQESRNQNISNIKDKSKITMLDNCGSFFWSLLSSCCPVINDELGNDSTVGNSPSIKFKVS